MKNFKIKDLKEHAMYSVKITDKWDGKIQVECMSGSELKNLTNGFGHLYDIYATKVETEEENLINTLLEIGMDNTSCVYSYVTGRISAIVKSNLNTADEKLEEIQFSLRCMNKALKKISKAREGA